MRDGIVPSKKRWHDLDKASKETKRILEEATKHNDDFLRLLRPWDYYDDLPKRRIIEGPEKIAEEVVAINEELLRISGGIFRIGSTAAGVEEEKQRRIHHRGIFWGHSSPWRMW